LDTILIVESKKVKLLYNSKTYWTNYIVSQVT